MPNLRSYNEGTYSSHILDDFRRTSMNGSQAIQTALKGTAFVMETYLSDLSDADLLIRPTAGANHIAWQLGHLIYSEQFLVKSELPESAYPALAAGFDTRHGKESSGSNEGFHTRAEYLDLFQKTRAATIAAVAKLSDADLDQPTKGVLAKFAPKLGDLLLLVSNHTLMHGGQYVIVRRQLGKPVLI